MSLTPQEKNILRPLFIREAFKKRNNQQYSHQLYQLYLKLTNEDLKEKCDNWESIAKSIFSDRLK